MRNRKITLVFSSLAIACSPSEPDPGNDGNDSKEEGDDNAGDSSADDSNADGTADAGDATGDSGDDNGGTGTGTGTDDGEFEIWPLEIDNWQVKPQETDYVCFEFTTTFEQLAHIVGFAPRIDNAPYVHHYILELIDEPSGVGDSGASCFSSDGQMLWAWAPGVDDMWLPNDAGLLVGDEQQGEVTLRLQVHYNNPLEATGEVDSSALDVYYTHALRENHAGVLTFGAISQLAIPPGEPAYEYVGTCNQTATILEQPVHVFGAHLHAHQIASVLWTDVFRDGELIYELNRDDPFTFATQNFKDVDFEMRPGDVVVNHCVYDSTSRTETTRGGAGSADEMCWETILYYPKTSKGFNYCNLE